MEMLARGCGAMQATWWHVALEMQKLNSMSLGVTVVWRWVSMEQNIRSFKKILCQKLGSFRIKPYLCTRKSDNDYPVR